MIRHRFAVSGRPWPLRALLGFFEILASPALAAVLLGVIAMVLLWAILIEEHYGKFHGAAVAQFGFYQATWFAVLLAFFGASVLASILIRFPWRREQIGFLLVHVGILVLLVGCWLDHQDGFRARLDVFEGQSVSRATLDGCWQFELTIAPSDPSGPSGKRKPTTTIEIPFRPGPFNWSDRSIGCLPWFLVGRDQGVLYRADGVCLETLDYNADSDALAVPRLRLRATAGDASRDMTLSVRRLNSPQMGHETLVLGSRETLPGGVEATFRLAESKVETDAFINARPKDPLGPLGQIVLTADGKTRTLDVEAFQKEKSPVALFPGGPRVALADLDATSFRAIVKVYAPGKTEPTGRLFLSAARPELDQQDRVNGVFGSYWYALPEKKASESKSPENKGKKASESSPTKPTEPDVAPVEALAAAASRVDILQGHDRRLYWRTWSNGRLGATAELPADGASAALFKGTSSAVRLSVVSFTPADSPGFQIASLPFDKEDSSRVESVKVRLTVDGRSREFWLAWPTPPDAEFRSAEMQGNDRVISLRLTPREVDLGFQVHLLAFEQQFDPGTTVAAQHRSRIDFLAPGEPKRPLRINVAIEMNRPAQCADPVSGRVYRLFQNSYEGPYEPGEQNYEEHVKPSDDRDNVYMSILSVSYDPGRQWKYAGSFLVVAGIAVMFSMRSYLSRTRRNP